ncbi:hypothetical protein [Kitasatospora sp. NPDC101183]|uniref:hypothetical protein n=1 Tax=Kitasatospora sp. NPDC101183 TaxID=3364100 RepID=UPI00382EAF11
MTPPRPVSATALTTLLEAEWEALRSAHPTLPPAYFVLSSAPPTPDHSPARWNGKSAVSVELSRAVLTGQWDGITIDPALLRQALLPNRTGAIAVITAVRHEAAHALNWSAGVDDCSRKGVYHNKKFRAAGELVGLEWPRDGYDPRSGFGDMMLTAQSAEAVDLEAMQKAVNDALRLLAPPPVARRAPTADRVLAECSCVPARKIRVAGSVLALGPITCGVCHMPFVSSTDL